MSIGYQPSRYDPLQRFLERGAAPATKMTFAEIEHVLGFALPPSARKYQAWWANDPHHSQAKAWLSAGVRSGTLNIPDETVVFTRKNQTTERPTSGFEEGQMNIAEPAQVKLHPAIGAMKGMVTIAPGTDLTAPVDPEWVERLHDGDATAGDLVGGLDEPPPGRR